MRTTTNSMRKLLTSVALRSGLSDEQVHTLYARAAWTTIVEPGDADGGLLRELLGVDESLRLLMKGVSLTEWMRVTDGAVEPQRMQLALGRWRSRLDERVFERALEQASRWNQRLITPEDPEWPEQLNDLGSHAPAALWARGNIETLEGCSLSVALVGARASTAYGEQVAAELAEGLVQRSMTIVSGGAYGIDAVAHRVALATEGHTVAVLAGGLDRWYPVAHSDLFERIERRGLIISEVPSGVTPSRWRFLQRNRIIAALATATVVVEASHRSGAINTAAHAATLGRALGAVPGPVTTGTSAGCHRTIRDHGAEPIESAEDVARLVTGCEGQPTLESAIGPLETRVLDALSRRTGRTIEEIGALAGMGQEDVLAAIGMLELAGTVTGRGNGYVRCA